MGNTREIGYNSRKVIIVLDKGEDHVNTLLDRQIDRQIDRQSVSSFRSLSFTFIFSERHHIGRLFMANG